MGKLEDLTNRNFGQLVVLYRTDNVGRKTRWMCRCSCGNLTKVIATHLKSSHTTSCGCFVRKHGMDGTPEYKAYHSAKGRCRNPLDKAYSDYGGRGIEFRFESFGEFFDELGFRPDGKTSIDRINVDGHYEKGNVRWEDSKEQSRNKRNTRLITWNDKSLTSSEWSEITGIKVTTIERRLYEYNYCVDCTFTLPIKKEVSSVTRCTHKNNA